MTTKFILQNITKLYSPKVKLTGEDKRILVFVLCMVSLFVMILILPPSTTGYKQTKADVGRNTLKETATEDKTASVTFALSTKKQESIEEEEILTNYKQEIIITIQTKENYIVHTIDSSQNLSQLIRSSEILNATLSDRTLADIQTKDKILEINEPKIQIQSEGSFVEIIEWYYFWIIPIPLGARAHVHLSPVDAINLGTALAALNVLMPILICLLAPTLAGGLAALVCTAIIAMMNIDYNTMYSADKSQDDSFDFF
ncbi:MAG: hypothetical protein QHH24_06320 [Candidatus Bathyarchaeota archaeon]|nr:hypothetical protein [Candidatus Bathyarchaeota archaeon]